MGKIARSSVVTLSVVVLITGCVSNKRHNQDVNNLQTQVNTLSGEVARLDAQTQAAQKPAFNLFGSQPAQQAPAPHKETSYVSTASYHTPSGFEIPAADIQHALKNAGYFNDEVDGKVGPKTRDALRAFQKDNSLKADGVCGKKTWDLLKTHLENSPIK